MNRIIKCATPNYVEETLAFVETVFTESEGTESEKEVRSLVEEIRSKKFYLPELDLVMVNKEDTVIGYAMFSRFHLEGRYENDYCCFRP